MSYSNFNNEKNFSIYNCLFKMQMSKDTGKAVYWSLFHEHHICAGVAAQQINAPSFKGLLNRPEGALQSKRGLIPLSRKSTKLLSGKISLDFQMFLHLSLVTVISTKIAFLSFHSLVLHWWQRLIVFICAKQLLRGITMAFKFLKNDSVNTLNLPFVRVCLL